MENKCSHLKNFLGINNHKARVDKKTDFWEVYISTEVELKAESKKIIESIYLKYNVNEYMFGHGNIYFKISRKIKKIKVFEIIEEIKNILL